MICRKCKKEVILDGVECPLCGANNQEIKVEAAPAPAPKVEKKEATKKKS